MDSWTSDGKTAAFEEGELMTRRRGRPRGASLDQQGKDGPEDIEVVRFRNQPRQLLPPANAADFEVEKVESVKMDPDLTQSSEEGRCGCCPYGYHIDLDFLRYLSALSNGELSQDDRKKMILNKKKLRKSMEFFLHQQELARKLVDADVSQSAAIGESAAAAAVIDGKTIGDKSLPRTIGADKDTDKFLEEFDQAINAQLRSMDDSTTSRDRLQTTAAMSREDVQEYRFRTEAEFKLSHLQTDYDDSCSSMSVSSGPSSPSSSQFSPALERSKFGKANAAAEETKQPPPTSSVSSIQMSNKMAALQLDRRVSTTKQDGDGETIHPPSSKDQSSKDLPYKDTSSKDPSLEDPATHVSQISSGTPQTTRRQLAAVSVERMRDLEEQIKAIPVLQLRLSILKEEKQQLMEQLNDKSRRIRSSERSDASESHVPTQRQIPGESSANDRFPGSNRGSAPPIPRKPLRSIGVGEGNVFADSATAGVTACNGVDAVIRIHERERNTQEHTELRERQTKTLFLGGDTSSSPQSPVSRRDGRHERPKVPPKPKSPRMARVGTTLPNAHSTNFEVHEKELRTLYIEDSLREARSTRNVGIQCRTAMRDVGVMHMSENERPMTRTIGVGVGEIGVGIGGFDLADGPSFSGLMSTVRSTASASCISSRLLTSAESKRIHIRDDQLRSVLGEMLKKTVHSVAVQCRFSTEDKGVDTGRVGSEEGATVDVGCGDDNSVDVDVVPRRQMRSVAVDNRPSVFHRASATDAPHTVDTASNTTNTHIPTVDDETNTDAVNSSTAATNTETAKTKSVSTAADPSLIGGVRSTDTNTELSQTSTIATSTVLVGEVEKPVLRPPSASVSTNTVSSSVVVQDVAVNTVVCQSVEMSVGTSSQVLYQDRSSNTDKSRVISASTNTDKLSCVSRAVGDFHSIYDDQETEFRDLKADVVNGSYHGVLIQEDDREQRDDDEDDDDTHGVSRVAGGCESVASYSFVALCRELSQSGSHEEVEEEEEVNDGSGSSSEAVVPDLKEIHDQTVRLRVSAKLEPSSGVEEVSEHEVFAPTESVSSNEVVAERYGARPRDLSFSFPDSNPATKATPQTLALVPFTSPVLSPMEANRRRMLFAGEMETEASALSPHSDSWLSASDDSVSTQCSVIERSPLNRPWAWGRSGEKEASTVDVAQQMKMGDREEGVEVPEAIEAVVVSSESSGQIACIKKGTLLDFCFGKQKPTQDSDAEDKPSSELDFLMDCLEITAITSGGGGGGGGDSSHTPKDGDGMLHASPATSDGIPGDGGGSGGGVRGGTLPPSPAAAAAFRQRYRDVAASSLDDCFLDETDVCASDEWPSGTSVFSNEVLDDVSSPKDLMQSSVPDDEDVEFPVALQLRGQGRRVIMMETRTERQRRRTSETDEGTGERVEENGDGRESGGATTSLGGTLKSIIKTTTSTEGGRTRKEITFLEGVVNNYVPAATEDAESESDGSRSSLSFDEGTYDSQLGRVLYTGAEDDNPDDRDDAVYDLDDFTFSDHNLRDMYELSEEMVAACTTYARWLEEEEELSDEQLAVNMAIIQSEWFYSTSQKLADPSQVEDYLTQINEMSRKLLEHIVNMADSNGNTALHYAISHCNMEVVNMILDTGVCDVDKRNRAGYNAIMLASLADIQTQRQRDVIRRLFDMGDVNQTALQAGQTALMLAVSHGDVNVVRMLLDAGAKVNMRDEDGSTALMCASEHGHMDIVKLLLAQDECDASLVDHDGSTAITIAMEAGHREIGILLYAHLNFKPGSPMASQRKIKKKTNEASSLTKN